MISETLSLMTQTYLSDQGRHSFFRDTVVPDSLDSFVSQMLKVCNMVRSANDLKDKINNLHNLLQFKELKESLFEK